MTVEMQTWLLGPHDVARLADDGAVSPFSPFAPFAGMSAAVGTAGATVGELSDDRRRILSVLLRPQTRVRIFVPGPSKSLVQFFYGNGRSVDGLIGCRLEGDGLLLSFPWERRHVAAFASQVVLEPRPLEVATEPLLLGPDGLAVFASAIDVVRSRLFDSLLRRDPTTAYRFGRDELLDQLAVGASASDARWLVTLLTMAGFDVQPHDGVIDRGFDELVAAGVLFGARDAWTPGPTMFTYASWWRNPLPAVSYDASGFSGGSIVRHVHHLALRGDGPLCVIGWGGDHPNAGVSVTTPAPLDYFETLVSSLEDVDRSSRRLVYVLEPEAARGLDDTTGIVGFLQPETVYELVRVEGDWAHVADPRGPLTGWVPVDRLRFHELQPGEPSQSPASAPGRDVPVPWEPSHVVPASGLRSWPAPDPVADPGADLPAGLRVQVVERRADWARVRAENQWEGWVDGRLLVAVSTGPPPPPPPPPLDEEPPAAGP